MAGRILFVSILLFASAVGSAEAPGSVPFPAPSTFRIVTFNVEWLFDGVNDSIDHWGSPALAQKHLEAVAAALGSLEADYISLAEVEDSAMLSRLNALLGNDYTPIFIQGNDTSTGQNVGALSLLPPQTVSRSDERVSFPVAGSTLRCGGGTAGVSKNYCADLDLAGTAITIIGVHFLAYPDRCDRSIEREAQAVVIRNLAREALLRGREVILLGDFNDFDGATLDAAGNRPISQVLPILKDLDPTVEGDELVNVCERLPQDDRYSDWYDRDRDGVDDGPSEHSQIDFILVSRQLWERVTYVTIDHGAPAGRVSDHWPVVLDLSLVSGTGSSSR